MIKITLIIIIILLLQNSNAKWNQTYKFTGTNHYGLGISSSKNTIVIGVPKAQYNSNGRYITIYKKGNENQWLKNHIIFHNNINNANNFGQYIDNTDNIVVVGCNDRVYVYEYLNNNWVESYFDNVVLDTYNFYVAINNNTIIVAYAKMITSNKFNGYVLFYEKNTTGWFKKQQIIQNGTSIYFGSSLDIDNLLGILY